MDALRPGEILVVHTTDVGWTPLFLVAAGVVTELGGPLSTPPSWLGSSACPAWSTSPERRAPSAPGTSCASTAIAARWRRSKARCAGSPERTTGRAWATSSREPAPIRARSPRAASSWAGGGCWNRQASACNPATSWRSRPPWLPDGLRGDPPPDRQSRRRRQARGHPDDRRSSRGVARAPRGRGARPRPRPGGTAPHVATGPRRQRRRVLRPGARGDGAPVGRAPRRHLRAPIPGRRDARARPAGGPVERPHGWRQGPRFRTVEGRDAIDAQTRYAVCGETAGGAALLALAPFTGRTHQLRVHASNAGASLVGDVDYGAPKRFSLPSGRVLELGHVLHAHRVAVPGASGPSVVATSPVPPALRGISGLRSAGSPRRGSVPPRASSPPRFPDRRRVHRRAVRDGRRAAPDHRRGARVRRREPPARGQSDAHARTPSRWSSARSG